MSDGVYADAPSKASAPAPKTLAEHREFLSEYVRLQLWFLWTWLSRHPRETFRFAIRNRVDILRKSDLNPGRSKVTPTAGDFSNPRWIALEEEAYRLYLQVRYENADLFEREAWKIFGPVIEARVERDFNEGDGLDEYQCGSLSYDAPRPLGTERLRAVLRQAIRGHPPAVFFHIGNRIAPRSMFADREYLPNCFFHMMAETRQKYYAGVLRTNTWLNSYPRWLELFPPQWRTNLSPPREDVTWAQASWGQFITSRGTFNYGHAKVLRRTGVLPYKPRRSWCSFADLEEYLRRYLHDG
jgi:hypothetical protein